MKETRPPSETSDKNPWSVMEDLSSSRDGSRRWPDWNTRESLKFEDTSEWPSWECSQGNRDIQKGDTMDTEVFASADSSFDEQRGRGILREISRDGGWNGSAKRHSEMSKRNSWHLTKDHSSSCNGHSHRWPDCDALNSSKCEDDSGWPSWECFRESNDTHGDTVDREVHTVLKHTFDEQRGQSKIRKRGRSRSRQREYSKSRSRSPCNGPRQASCRVSEKGSFSEKTSRRCRDFAAGKCCRGSQCRFLHQGYLNSRHRDHPRNDELTDRSKFRADDRGGTSQFCDYKGSASGPCDKISDNCEDYCEEVEIRKAAVCWKKPLEEKCFREESFRYSHHRSSGEEYDRRNERIVYDQNVKPFVKQNDIGHCKFFTVGRCHQNDCRFSHDVSRVTTGFLDAAKTKNCDDFGKGEDEIESEKCSAWDKFAGLSEKPKDTTGWGKWPGKSDNYILNSNSHDSMGGENTRLNWGEDEIKSQKCSAWDKFAAVSEKPKDTTGWGKWPGKPDNDIWNSNFHDSLRGENARSNQKGVQHRTKPSGRGEDEIKSKKCSAWDKFTSMPEKPKDTRWGKWPGKPDNYIWNSNSHSSQSKRWDGRSEGSIYSQDLSEVKKQTDSNILHNSVRSGKRYDSGSNEKLSKRDKLMDLNMTVDREKVTGQGKDKTESWNGPTCDKDWSLDRPKAKVSVWGENVKKSENGLTWDKFAGVSKRPKDTTSRDNWPAWPDSSNANSNSHDPQNKTWDGRSRGNIYSQDLIDGKNHSDINILYNSVKKSSERADPGQKEKFPEREEIFQSHLRDGAANNTNMDLMMLAKKEKAKLSEWGENTKKSENGLAWDKFAGLTERRKDNTSWDNWPAWPDSSNGNLNSHDPQRKRQDCRSEGSINSQDLRDAKKQADDNIFYNAVKKSSERADPECNVKFYEREEFPQSHMRNDAANKTNISHSFVQKVIQKSSSSSEWNKKVTVRDANRLSPLLNDYNGAGSNTIKVSDSVKLNDGKKSTNQGEDEKNSWNPKCDDSTCFLDNKKASGWGGSRSSNDRHCHDPVDEETKNCDDFGKGEDEIESEKCSAWDKFAGLSEKPKDTTGWGKWPGKSDNYILNSNSHDSMGGENTRLNWGEDEIKSQKCSAWDKFAAVSEKPKDTTGWGKWPGKPDNDIWNSNFHDSLGGENARSNQKGVQHRTKPSGRGEDEIKSKKCSAWDKFTSMPEKPKDARWGKWPGKPDNYIWNSNSHSSQSKRWDGRSEGSIYSQDLSEVKKQTDSNILHNSVRSGKRYDSGSNEKLSKRDKLMDLNMTVDREKVTGQGKDKTESWNGPTCDKDWSLDRPKAKVSVWGENVKKSENGLTWDKFAGVSKRPKDTTSRDNWPAWPDSSNANSNSHDPQNKTWDGRSRGNIYSQDLIDGKNHSDINILYNSVKKSSERADPGQKEKFPEREEIFQSHLRDGAANNTNMDLMMLAKKEKAKLSEWGENTKKSENGLAWDKFAGLTERRKDNTSWDNWPAWPDSSNGNLNSHDPQRKRQDCRSEGSINSQDLRDAKKQADDNIFYNAVKKSSERADPECNVKFYEREEFPQSHMRNDAANKTNISHSFVQKVIQKSSSSSEWNKKVTVRDANRLSPLLNDYNGAGSNTIKVSDSVKLNDGKKSTNQGEDEKNSWNPKCDDSTCFLDNKKASGWGGSRSSNDRHCHDPVDEEKPSQNNLVKTYCEMAISEQENKVVVKDEYSPAHMLNGREGEDKDTGNLLASKKILYSKENQVEAKGSEPSGFIFPPSSLMGLSESSHALSPNLSNGLNAILDESAKYKLSALVNQMQKQFEEALKILEMWACQNSITSDQAFRLSKLQACLSENGVHVNSNEVLRKLKMEYLESSATIFKQEPVEYTELNQKTVMVEKVSGNNSKGEQCKKEEEIIQSVGADARCEAGESKQDEKSMWLFKNALVKLVKEILNPIWMEGQMKKEVHNTIVKKVVDKVISTEGINIPRTQEHAEQYLSFSKPQISALINDYVVYFKRRADSS